jgi:hypothetical protein
MAAVTFDEDAYTKNLARWATQELAMFEVDGWPEAPSVGGSSGLVGVGAAGETTQIVMSRTVTHRRADGGWIDVMSHRPDDYEGDRQWLPGNMMIRVAKRLVPRGNASRHNETVARLCQEAADGTIPWNPTTISVDGADVPFEVLAYEGVWVAIGEVSDVFVLLDSNGVDMSEVKLVAMTSTGL